MAVLVKICGINSAEAADAAARAGADFAGLMFHPKSPRHVTPEAARSLAQRLRDKADRQIEGVQSTIEQADRTLDRANQILGDKAANRALASPGSASDKSD